MIDYYANLTGSEQPWGGSWADYRPFESLVVRRTTQIEYATPSAFWEDDASQEQIYLADGTAHVFVGNALPQPATGANGSVHMYLTFHDGRNSSAVLVDHDTGELVERTAYQPFGAPDIDYRPACPDLPIPADN